MKIYLFRHGETQDNVNKIFSGSRNVALSKNGEIQAGALAKRLSDKKFDIILSSDLDRAVNTLKVVCPNSSFEKTKYLRERNFGVFEGGKKSELFNAIDHSDLPKEEFCPEGGESFKMMESRIFKLWNEYLSSFKGTVLLSGHGSINRSFLKFCLGLSYAEQFQIKQGNTCLNILEGTELGMFKASAINCTKHLQ